MGLHGRLKVPERAWNHRANNVAIIFAVASFAACSAPARLTPALGNLAATRTTAAREQRNAAGCTNVHAYGAKSPQTDGKGNEGQGYSIDFIDRSGLAREKKPAYLYVQGGGNYLDTTTGAWTKWPNPAPSPSRYEYPLSCFEKAPFYLPPIASGARVYISYGALLDLGASQQPDGDLPPAIVAAHKNANYSTYWDLWEYAYISGSRDEILTDTSAVDAFGLPIRVTLKEPIAGNLRTYGPEKPYAQIVDAFSAVPGAGKAAWESLIVWGCTNPASSTSCTPAKPKPDGIPYRILSPAHGTVVVAPPGKTVNTHFPVDYLYNKLYFSWPPNEAAGKGYDEGYLGYVEHYYDANANKATFVQYQVWVPSTLAGKPDGGCDTVKADNVPGAIYPCPLYTARYDKPQHAFVFDLLKPAPKHVASLGDYPAQVVLPASIFTQIYQQATFTCVTGSSTKCTATPGNGIWNNSGVTCPTPGSTLACFQEKYDLQVPFYVYKAFAADFTRGVATQLADHAVLPCSDLKDCPKAYVGVLPYGKNYYRDPDLISKLPTAFSVYAQILHDDFVGGWVYANSYDDYFNQSTTSTGYVDATSHSSGITVTVEPMKR
jgi:Beta-1,3-glucanase